MEAGSQQYVLAPDVRRFRRIAEFDDVDGQQVVARLRPLGPDREVVIDAAELSPFVTWGTNPAQGVPLDAAVPDPAELPKSARAGAERALTYMDLAPKPRIRAARRGW